MIPGAAASGVGAMANGPAGSAAADAAGARAAGNAAGASEPGDGATPKAAVSGAGALAQRVVAGPVQAKPGTPTAAKPGVGPAVAAKPGAGPVAVAKPGGAAPGTAGSGAPKPGESAKPGQAPAKADDGAPVKAGAPTVASATLAPDPNLVRTAERPARRGPTIVGAASRPMTRSGPVDAAGFLRHDSVRPVPPKPLKVPSAAPRRLAAPTQSGKKAGQPVARPEVELPLDDQDLEELFEAEELATP